jgi:hypothetical protein
MHLTFVYSDGLKKRFGNIEKVEYYHATDKSVSGEEMLKHHFPLDCDFHLFSKDISYTVSHKGLAEIIVTRGND